MNYFILLPLIAYVVNSQADDSELDVLLPSSQTQSISACWLLTIYDNANEYESFEQLLETLQAQNLSYNEAVHGIQLNMIKRCFTHITEDEIKKVLQNIYQKVIDAVDDEDVQILPYRAIVKDFEYSNYLEELRVENIKKNEGTYTAQKVDEVIMMMINELELQYGMANSEEEMGFDDIPQEDDEIMADL